MYQLSSQWHLEQTSAAGKREQLLILLREVGKPAFTQAIQRCISEYQSEFYPPIGVIRKFVSHPPGDKRTWWRDPNCPQCHGTGFYYVTDSEADRLYGKNHLAVKRCEEPGCLHR